MRFLSFIGRSLLRSHKRLFRDILVGVVSSLIAVWMLGIDVLTLITQTWEYLATVAGLIWDFLRLSVGIPLILLLVLGLFPAMIGIRFLISLSRGWLYKPSDLEEGRIGANVQFGNAVFLVETAEDKDGQFGFKASGPFCAECQAPAEQSSGSHRYDWQCPACLADMHLHDTVDTLGKQAVAQVKGKWEVALKRGETPFLDDGRLVDGSIMPSLPI